MVIQYVYGEVPTLWSYIVSIVKCPPCGHTVCLWWSAHLVVIQCVYECDEAPCLRAPLDVHLWNVPQYYCVKLLTDLQVVDSSQGLYSQTLTPTTSPPCHLLIASLPYFHYPHHYNSSLPYIHYHISLRAKTLVNRIQFCGNLEIWIKRFSKLWSIYLTPINISTKMRHARRIHNQLLEMINPEILISNIYTAA